MPTDLYLDTARFGLMALSAQRAGGDFARLCGEEGGSAHIDELLRGGSEAWPSSMRDRYPGLAGWQGVSRLKEAFGRFACAPPETPVFLASRSAQLMKLAARALFLRCRSVLHTDMEWPGYLAILDAECRRAKGRLVCFPARDACLRGRLEGAEFVRTVTTLYRHEQCEGLFLSAVSFEGLRLPVAEIVSVLSHVRLPRFVVVDGAQALAHLPAGLPACDVYLAGCHKWLGAGHPMGLAFQPRRGSQSFIEKLAGAMMAAGDLDDPLLTFTSHLERGRRDSFNETVDLAGLFSCGGAVAAELAWPGRTAAQLESRLVNAGELAEVVRPCGWQPLLADSSFRSGIVLVQANVPGTRAAAPEAIRSRFQQQGVAVTTYADGLVRVSLPAVPWKGKDLDQLRAAFTLCS